MIDLQSRPAAPPEQLLRLPQVMEIAGLGKTMIYRLVRQQRFPQPCKPGGFATRWDRDEVLAWKAQQLQQRNDHRHAA